MLRRAVNTTASSALALRMTNEALHQAATNRTSEVLDVLSTVTRKQAPRKLGLSRKPCCKQENTKVMGNRGSGVIPANVSCLLRNEALEVSDDWVPECTSPVTHDLLEDRYIFNVRAVDRAGLHSRQDHIIIVDSTPPTARITSTRPVGPQPTFVAFKFTGKDEPERIASLADPNVATCLVTGNLQPIGWGKMRALGIEHLFSPQPFGGFGADFCSGNIAESWKDRSELVAIAAKRAEELVEAEGAGATPVGVTTGIFSKQQLEESVKPETNIIVLEGLAEPAKVTEALNLNNHHTQE
ncbi:hypothetical protein BSKO_13887 [Bryopsis sp. KO-2023]|nr:hypothetical protein BSKO_13887 [Bryopsis sp. KO-2023]